MDIGQATRRAIRLWGSAPRRVPKLARALAADPAGVARALPGEILQRRGHVQYAPAELDDAWEEQLHGLLGAPWPCPQRAGLDEVLAGIGTRLGQQGLGSGRHTYGWYSDADVSLSRAVWCTVLHTRPEVVVETGVAHGVTSRIVLEGLVRNDRGHLWSIDLPHPLDQRLHAQTGAAVTDGCRPRWTYLEGASRDRLPPLIREVSRVDLFIHDSLHTARNTRFELEQAASAQAAGGAMLVDDIAGHNGFATFARQHPSYRTIICPSADGVGVFGVAVSAGGTVSAGG
jgi:methyltransferase family protein